METGFIEHYAPLFQNVVMLGAAILSACAILMFLRAPTDLRQAVQRHNRGKISASRARFRFVDRQGVLLALPACVMAVDAAANPAAPVRMNGAVHSAVAAENAIHSMSGVEEFNRVMHVLRS